MAADLPSSTATLGDARAHARSQAAGAIAPVTVPSISATDLPHGVEPEAVLWDEVVPLGGYASRRLPRSAVLRLTDIGGDACAQLLVWDAHNSAERLNVADTVKVQWQAYLGPGSVLLSDLGRALMTVVDDTSGRHDCLCGASTSAANAARWGDGSPAGATPSGRDLLVLGAMKLGLARVDVGPNVNLFKAARVAEDGSLSLDGDPAAGAHVHLRAEADVLVAVAVTPHPLDERPAYAGSPVRLIAWRSSHPDPDPFRATSPERERAFLNADELRRGRPS